MVIKVLKGLNLPGQIRLKVINKFMRTKPRKAQATVMQSMLSVL